MTNLKANVRLYFYDNMDDSKPILDYLTRLMFYWECGRGGLGHWNARCSGSFISGCKWCEREQASSVCALTVHSMFGTWCLATAQDVSGSRLHLPHAAFWPPSPEKGHGREGSGGVPSQLSGAIVCFSRFTDVAIAAGVALGRGWKGAQSLHECVQ